MAATRQRFQGKCLVATEGHMWMRQYYDDMSPAIRKRLMDSPFNICAACVWKEAIRQSIDIEASDRHYNAAINKFEAIILAETGPFGPQPVNPAPLVAKPRRMRHGVKVPADLLDLPQTNPG